MLRILMAICALCVASVSAQSDELTFRVKSLHKFITQIKYYSPKGDVLWPGPNSVVELVDDEVHVHRVPCQHGVSICYGAGSGDVQWGMGSAGRLGCSDCCWTCENARTPIITLSSSGVPGKVNKHIARVTLDTSQDVVRGILNMDMPGGDFTSFSAISSLACHNSCGGNPTCKAWTWKSSTRQCFLKNSVPNMVSDTCCVSAEFDQDSAQQMWNEDDTDRFGSDIANFATKNSSACRTACMRENRCASWSYVLPTKQGQSGSCFLKDQVAQAFFKHGVISGVKLRRENQ
jgi:PAN domain